MALGAATNGREIPIPTALRSATAATIAAGVMKDGAVRIASTLASSPTIIAIMGTITATRRRIVTTGETITATICRIMAIQAAIGMTKTATISNATRRTMAA